MHRDIFKHYRYVWDNLQLHALARNTHIEFSDIFSHDGCLWQWPSSPECEITNCQLFIDMHTNCHPVNKRGMTLSRQRCHDRKWVWNAGTELCSLFLISQPHSLAGVIRGSRRDVSLQTYVIMTAINPLPCATGRTYTRDQTFSFISHNYDAVALHVLLYCRAWSCHVSPDAAARPSNVGRLVLCPQQLIFTH